MNTNQLRDLAESFIIGAITITIGLAALYGIGYLTTPLLPHTPTSSTIEIVFAGGIAVMFTILGILGILWIGWTVRMKLRDPQEAR